MQPAFLPSPEEVATNFESVLNDRFTVIPLDGDRARQSFEREARRILPARAGVGGRDTAIWLTAVGLIGEGHDVHFVTSNLNDFGKAGLPDSMLAEIEGMSGVFTYYHSLNDFVDAIATKTAAPEIDSGRVASVFEDSIRSSVIIMLTDDEGGNDPQDRVLDSSLELTALKWVGTYVVDGAGLAMVKASYRLVDELGRPEWAAGNFEAWFEFDPESLAVEPAEVDTVDVQSR